LVHFGVGSRQWRSYCGDRDDDVSAVVWFSGGFSLVCSICFLCIWFWFVFFFCSFPPLSNFLFRNNPISNHKKYRFLLFFWVFHSLLFFSFPFSSFSSINSWLKIPSFLTQNSLSLSLSLSLSIYIYIYIYKDRKNW